MKVIQFPSRPLPPQPDLLDRNPDPSVVRFFVPSVRRCRPWLRRQGLRIAAMVGGATFVEVERYLRIDHAKYGISGEQAERDIEEALAFVRYIRDEADKIGRDPDFTGWGHSA